MNAGTITHKPNSDGTEANILRLDDSDDADEVDEPEPELPASGVGGQPAGARAPAGGQLGVLGLSEALELRIGGLDEAHEEVRPKDGLSFLLT
jgi:hypothetical protein